MAASLFVFCITLLLVAMVVTTVVRLFPRDFSRLVFGLLIFLGISCILFLGVAVTLVSYRSMHQAQPPFIHQSHATSQVTTTVESREPRILLPHEVKEVPASATVTNLEEEAPNLEEEATKVSISTPRPAWVDQPSKRIGHVTRRVLKSGPFQTVEECYEADLNNRLQAAIREYTQELVQSDVPPSWLDLTPQFLRREICREEFVETVEASFGPMKRVYVLVEFGPDIDRTLQQFWITHQRKERLKNVGIGAGTVLGLLALTLGFLRRR